MAGLFLHFKENIMKKYVAVTLALLMASNVAFADGAISGSNAQSASGATAANQGNAQSIHFNSKGEDSLKTVPNVYAPGLAASFTECFGSRSGGASFLGFGGSAGATVVDQDCNRRRDAQAAVALGKPDLAYQVMCMNPNFFKADQVMLQAQCIAKPE
jgi:hypothetical protein